MSKRKTPTTTRPSKRHKSSDYDGKTQLEREMECFKQHEAQQEEAEFNRAQQELQQQHTTSSTTNNNIQYGSSDDDDDDDDDIATHAHEEAADMEEDDDVQNGNDARDGDYAPPSTLPPPHAHTHPERLNRIRDSGVDPQNHHRERHHHHDQGVASENEHKPRDVDSRHDQSQPQPQSRDRRQPPSNSHAHSHVQASVPRDEDVNLKDLRNVQMKRDQLEKICSEPYFGEFVSRVVDDDAGRYVCPGFFCRMFIGERDTSQGGTEAVYRICEIVGVEDYPRSYTLTNNKKQTVNIALVLAHGKQKRNFKLIQASNQAFTQQEFNAWQQQMQTDGLVMPSKDALNEKYMAAIKMHRNFKYDETQIAILKEKKSRNFNARTLANPHKEKLKMSALVQSLGEDDPERPRYVLYLSDINKEIERRSSASSQAVKVSIAAINERNKLKDKELMLKAREKERLEKLRMQGSEQTKDPFTRAITAPQIESFNNLVFDEERDAAKEEQKTEMKAEHKMSATQKAEHELQNLSILQLQLKSKHKTTKGLEDEEDKGKHEVSAKDGLLIGKDRLWASTVHEVAKQFMQACSEVMVDGGYDRRLQLMRRQAQFGRNTNTSKYGHAFTRKPSGLRIISIDEYLHTQKYDRQ